MTKETKTLLGLAGAVCLIFGLFAPFATAPIVGGITALKYSGAFASVIVVAAVLGGYFATRAAFRYVAYAGVLGIASVAFAVIWFETNMSRAQSQISTELANNPFAGLAAAAMQSVQLSWGVAVLGIGAALLILAGTVKSPGMSDGDSASVDPRAMRWIVGLAAAVVVGVVGYNLLGGMFLGNTVVTSSNQAQIEQQVASSNMSDGDKAEFSAALLRTEYAPTGKTVNQVVSDQRAFEIEQKAEQERAAQLAAQERAKREATLKTMLGSLTVGVVSKSFQAADVESGTYQDQIAETFIYKNTSSKTIRAFKGVMVYKTLMGDLITKINLENDTPIEAGHSITWDGVTDYNQFEDKDVKLRQTKLMDMKIEWQPTSILFADGSRLEVTDDSDDNSSS